MLSSCASSSRSPAPPAGPTVVVPNLRHLVTKSSLPNLPWAFCTEPFKEPVGNFRAPAVSQNRPGWCLTNRHWE
eukprot:scaffold60402_cov34-Phaeocystis_antarctica.AAC.1